MKPLYILMTDDGRFVHPAGIEPENKPGWTDSELEWQKVVDANNAFPRASIRFTSRKRAEAYLRLTEKLRLALIEFYKEKAKKFPHLAELKLADVKHHEDLNIKVVKLIFEDC